MNQRRPWPRGNPPTPEELRALCRRWGLTGSDVAELVNVSPRTFRKWLGGERAISFAAFYTLVSRACGVEVTPDGWRGELSQ